MRKFQNNESSSEQAKAFHRSETSIILTFLFATFLVGVTGALQYPVMSTFLKDHVHLPSIRPFFIDEQSKVPSFWIGLFFFINALVGIIIGQLIGVVSDKAGDRKRLITYGCLFGVLQCLLFAFSRSYWLLITIGIVLASIGGIVHAQLFAMAREFTIKRGKSSDLFTSTMRAGISLAWVVGPPIAFFMIINFDFTALYLFSAIGLLCSLSLILVFLPKTKVVAVKKKISAEEKRVRVNFTILLLMIACTFLFAANGMYIITMPLYIVETLKLSKNLPGIMMGVVAGIEIPFIILTGLIANKIPKKMILMVCAICALIFYLIIASAHTPWMLISAQVFNAIFIGLLASIGIIYFQELMPTQAGNATTLFMNSGRLGSLLSGLGFAFIVQFFGYVGVFYVAAGLAIIALVCLSVIKTTDKEPKDEQTNNENELLPKNEGE